jgi:hypothetical protein
LIQELRTRFNGSYTPERYASLLAGLDDRCGVRVKFRVAETPVFLARELLEEMAGVGAELTRELIGNSVYKTAARKAIPAGYNVDGETERPHFLTADFALIDDLAGNRVPRLVEIQAFPSVFGYQAMLGMGYREAFALDETLGMFLGGLNEQSYWELLGRTILRGHDPENVVLTEVDPLHQKTLPDFQVMVRRLGIGLVDISSLEVIGNKLQYRNASGKLIPIDRIYNRAIADELIARNIRLPFDLQHPWDVEWAGHPNWYFLISKFSIPWLSRPSARKAVVPPAVFLSDFLAGGGREELADAGVPMPARATPDAVYSELLLKPLFSFAGKGIQFDPSHEQLMSIPVERRDEFLLQQRMNFVPTIETQAEIRILYLWPDGGDLTPALSLIRLGRGKMMGVDHNRNQEWVGASAAFYPG